MAEEIRVRKPLAVGTDSIAKGFCRINTTLQRHFRAK